MNKNTRIESAKETLQIIEKKHYQVPNTIIDIGAQIEYSIENSKLYTAENLSDVLLNTKDLIEKENRNTHITVENCTSMQAFEKFASKEKVGCLNFASAKNAGGGFISGAQAQEESLARASSLYPTQMKFYSEMYEYNRSIDTFLYSDRMIYSPSVCFFKDDHENLLAKPYCMDILTSPAVNVGALNLNRCTNELPLIKNTMIERIDKMLALFYHNNVKNLILGAWGCGVFRNNPADIANYFSYFLTKNGKYRSCFDNIIFAVYDTGKKEENFTAFKKEFI